MYAKRNENSRYVTESRLFSPGTSDNPDEALQPSSALNFRIMTDVGPYKFKHPLCFNVETEKDGFTYLSNEESDLRACGDDMCAALDDLLVELDFAWHEYALSDGDGFHESALEYRAWLLSNVEGPSQ